jgi:hypothetical protein
MKPERGKNVNERIKLIAASLILLLLATNGWIRPAVAQDSVTLDGNWWQSLSEDEQLVAVESDISALELGYLYGITAPALIGHPWSSNIYLQLLRREPRFPHTFGYYIAAITDFYVMHSRAIKAPVSEVLSCLADNPMSSCARIVRASQ